MEFSSDGVMTDYKITLQNKITLCIDERTWPVNKPVLKDGAELYCAKKSLLRGHFMRITLLFYALLYSQAVLAQKAVTLDETIQWLAIYFNDTSETFESFDPSTNILKTFSVQPDASSTRFAYDVCTLGKTKPTYDLHWTWNNDIPSAVLGVQYGSCHWTSSVKGVQKTFTSCTFTFPKPSRILETELQGENLIIILQKSKDENLKFFLDDPDHPYHRFVRAMDALVKLRCKTEESPFEQ